MRISAQHLLLLFQKKVFKTLPLAKLSQTRSPHYWFNKQNHLVLPVTLTEVLLEEFVQSKQTYLEVYLDESHSKIFQQHFPHLAFECRFKTNLYDALGEIEKLKRLNKHSCQQRSLVYTKDVKQKVSAHGLTILDTSQGVALEKEYLLRLLKIKGKNYLIEYGYPECGILLFIERRGIQFGLRERVLKFFEKLPSPVYEANDEAEFFRKRKTYAPHLFFFCYSAASSVGKIISLKLRCLDPLAKIFHVDQSAFELTLSFSKKLLALYTSGYVLEQQKAIDLKPPLPAEYRSKLITKIEVLSRSYDLLLHAQLVYVFDQLKTHYSVGLISGLMKKLEKQLREKLLREQA